MNPKYLFLTVLLTLFVSTALTGCKTEAGNPPSKQETAIKNYLRKAAGVKKDVKMVLESSKKEDEIRVSVFLDNPEKKPLTSVQSWFSFNPLKLKGKEIVIADSAFRLAAPYANAFDNIDGLVMVGRSSPDPVAEARVKVAEIVFSLVKGGIAMLDVYDYREDLSGHTSVNVMMDGKPYNILKKPETPILVLQN